MVTMDDVIKTIENWVFQFSWKKNKILFLFNSFASGNVRGFCAKKQIARGFAWA